MSKAEKENVIDVTTEIIDEIDDLEETDVADVISGDEDENVGENEVDVTKEEVSDELSDDVEESEKGLEEEDQVPVETSPEVEEEALEEDLPSEELEEEIENEKQEETQKEEKPKEKKARRLTRGDIIAAFKEQEELRMRNLAEKEEQSLKWHIVQDHLHTKKIARGTVISVEETPSGMVVAVVNFNGFRTVIPASEFFIKPIAVEPDVSDFQRVRREKQILSKSLGAEIEFIIVHAKQEVNKETKQKEYIVLASRKQALAKQRKYYFGKKSGVRRVEAGKIIRNVPIIAVGKEALMVSVCGIDKIMTKAQLSYKFLGSLIGEYNVGDRLDVAVLDVIEKEDDGSVDIQISHKQTQLEQFRRNVQNCSEGGMYRGVITIVKENTVQLYLTDVDVPAFSKIVKLNAIEDLPSAGDTVLFVANKIVPDRGLVLGTIIRVIKK